ncbi:MAG: FxsA family protein [Actinomycetota bacterium]|nr:FxsA family protein [Actinomycetota bacterium]
MLFLFLILFIAVPIAELWLLIKIGGEIGLVPTLALLVVDSIVGAALARSQSRAAWERFNRALAAGRVPAREVFDGAMIILGGALLLAPGFLTDIVGLVLLVPPSRAVVRSFLARSVSKRAGVAWGVSGFGRDAGGPFRKGPERGYDYEGSATEVTEPPPELPKDAREIRRG